MDTQLMSQVLLIILIIVGVLGSLALFFFMSAFRRFGIVMKKIDYLVEDVSYKSEQLGITIDTITKLSNYVNSLDAFTRRNYKKSLKLILNNKDSMFRFIQKLKEEKVLTSSGKASATKNKASTARKVASAAQEATKTKTAKKTTTKAKKK